MSTWKNKRKSILIKCENCGNEFEKTLSEYNRSEKKGGKHYCSLECNKDAKKRTKKKCLCCGNMFLPNDRNSKYCSKSCAATHTNKNRKGEKKVFTEKGKKNIRIATYKRYGININEYLHSPSKCKLCGKSLPYNKRNYVFCNRQCKTKYDRINMSEYQKYYRECKFKFSLNEYPNEFDFSLIEQYGWYQAKNHGDNLNGISRDHMISVKFGYENNIESKIISHPANCQLMRHNDNVSKNKGCSISIEELNKKINIWETKYNN